MYDAIRAGRARLLLFILVTSAVLALPMAAIAQGDAADSRCVGLNCASAANVDYVPEAHGTMATAAGLEELTAQPNSGFYEVPAPVYQGKTLPAAAEPRAVVYLSKAGQYAQMPASVRGLRGVKDFTNLNAKSFIVIEAGHVLLVPNDPVAAAARRPRAKAASSGCPSRYFCVYGAEGFEGYPDLWYGPTYAGTEWWNYGSFFNYNFGSSMGNVRDGDSLLADGFEGNGTRYCAQQQSEDSTFENNPIGLGHASSVALLGRTPDRC